MKKYWKNKSFCVGAVLIGIVFAMFLVSCIWKPYDPTAMDMTHKLCRPSFSHILGTDKMGRDIYVRLMQGVKVSFGIGIAVVAAGGSIGFFTGAFAGYLGGWADAAIQKIIDTLMAFPGVLLALMLIAVFGNGIENTILALSLMAVPKFARITRGSYRKLKEAEFVKAEKIRGAGILRIMFIHILPNMAAELAATASLSFASAVMAEAGLSYLGMGITPPDPSLGSMLSEAQASILAAPWFVLIPAVCITILVLGFNQLGDGIQEVCDDR